MINPDELLLCVDENNQPIVPVSREAAHRDHIWHRVVHIIVTDPSHKRILCQQRSQLKDSNPGKFECCFGGHATSDQSVDDAVVRELYEELGILTPLSKLVSLGYLKCVRAFEFQYQYTYVLHDPIHELHFEAQEIQQIFWAPIPKLIEIVSRAEDTWTYPDNILEILEKLAQARG